MSSRKTVTALLPPSVDVAKERDFWLWYRQSLEKADLFDDDDQIPGFYILKVRLKNRAFQRSPDHLPCLHLASIVCHLGEDLCIS